jgi:hypothetical protein
MKLPNVTMTKGNPFDKENVVALSADYSIVYSCIGLHKYERKYWAEHWPLVIDNLLAAVTPTVDTKNKSRLVFCDNLYAYAPTEIVSPRSNTVEPSDKSKPTVRATIRQTLQTFMAKHPGLVASVGGADFFGPHATCTSFLGDTLTGKMSRVSQPWRLVLFHSFMTFVT